MTVAFVKVFVLAVPAIDFLYRISNVCDAGPPDIFASVPPPTNVIVGVMIAPVSVLTTIQSVVSTYLSVPDNVGNDALPEPSVDLVSLRNTLYDTFVIALTRGCWNS